jgi:filamentous hemagglutinin family protein
MVAGNPWLAKGEAKVILNEVNSRDPSNLNGMIEVAGKKAQVVIANPAGITCNGCGFINANRATLTTGQAQLKTAISPAFRSSAAKWPSKAPGWTARRRLHRYHRPLGEG